MHTFAIDYVVCKMQLTRSRSLTLLIDTQASTTPLSTHGNAFKGLISILNSAILVKTFKQNVRMDQKPYFKFFILMSEPKKVTCAACNVFPNIM